MPSKHDRGIIRTKDGFRVYVYAAGEQREKRYPLTTSLKTMKEWRDSTRVSLRQKEPITGDPGTLHGDATAYLLQVKAMPTYEQRRQHIEMWLKVLGPLTPRSQVTPAQIRTALQAWRAGGFSAATCNKMRSALMHLWSTLDGKGARNPVRDVPKFKVDDAVPRGRDPHTIDAALLEAPRCRTRACARVMLWTGMRPVELDRAEPDDLDLANKTLIVRTAKGGRVRVIPLSSQAVSAWKEFIAEDCWHRVPNTAPANRLLKKWTGVEMRIYDLRHSYGTALARRQTRLDVIGSLMGHSTLELTKRYTLAAVTPDALTATGKLARKLSPAPPSRGPSQRAR